MPLKKLRAKRPLERDILRQIVHLFDLAGCTTYRTDQGYRSDPGGTRMTPGLADLLVFLPMIPDNEHTFQVMPYIGVAFGCFEVKTPDGLKLHHRNLAKRERRAVAQDRFGTLCRERRIPYAMGHIEQAWQFLAAVGLAHVTPHPYLPDPPSDGVARLPGYTLIPRRP